MTLPLLYWKHILECLSEAVVAYAVKA